VTAKALRICLTKKCWDCKKRRQLKFFYSNKTKSDGLADICKTCQEDRLRQWKKKNRSKYAEMQRRHALKRLYGITPKEYEALLQYQNGCCAVCHRLASEFKTRLAVEHRHDTGLIYGLCCINCNRAILGRHRLEWLEGAVAYHHDPPAFHVLGKRYVPGKEA